MTTLKVSHVITEDERTALANALRVAAEQYTHYAFRASGFPRVAQQFLHQKAEALRLASEVENAPTIAFSQYEV